jgi:toxin ParE1/3/4
MALVFSNLAERDLADIAEYIGQDSPERAVSFIARLRARCARLCDFPKAAPMRPELGEGIRMVPFGRYLIFYEEDRDDVLIQRIIHGARDYRALF